MTPKSLAEVTGFKVAPRNDMLRFCGSLFNICLVPRKKSLVLPGSMSKLFSQHHWATLRRSYSSLAIAASSSISRKDRNNFESSTYDSRLQELGVKPRVDHSDKYRIAVVIKSPLEGTPWMIGRVSEWVEPILTYW